MDMDMCMHMHMQMIAPQGGGAQRSEQSE